MRRRAAPVAALAVAGAGALALLAAGIASAGTGALLPDLVPELPAVPGHPQYANTRVDRHSAPGRILLRFDAVIRNLGPGPFELRGTRPDTGTPEMSAEQVTYQADGTEVTPHRPLANAIYWGGDGHNHWHYLRAARYDLWTPAGPGAGAVGPSAKLGFCMFDTYDPPAGSGVDMRYVTCGSDPGLTEVSMGISPTWGDLYSLWLNYQWIDVTGVAPGPYRIRAEIDPDRQFAEADTANQVVFRDTYIDGLVAHDLAAGAAPGGRPRQITLPAEALNAPYAPAASQVRVRDYRIVTAPGHGTITRSSTASATVTYTPAAGHTGPDSFTFQAVDTATGARSQTATVTLTTDPPPPGVPAAPAPDPAATATAGAPTAPAVAVTSNAAPLTVTARRTGPRRLAVVVRSRTRAGQVRVQARMGGRAVGSCRRAVPRGRAVVCPITLTRRASDHLTVEARLSARRGGPVLAVAGADVP